MKISPLEGKSKEFYIFAGLFVFVLLIISVLYWKNRQSDENSGTGNPIQAEQLTEIPVSVVASTTITYDFSEEAEAEEFLKSGTPEAAVFRAYIMMSTSSDFAALRAYIASTSASSTSPENK